MIPYLLAVVGGYFIGSSMKDETSKYDEGGVTPMRYKNMTKSDWETFYIESKKEADSKTFKGYYNKYKLLDQPHISYSLKKSKNFEDFYERLNHYGYWGIDSGVRMANGGYLKNYNVFGKVKVLVHAHADETDYETTDFSIDVMALNEQEAMVMVEEQLMDEYLLDDYGTSMLGYKVHYTGEVDIEDVVEIKE